MKIFLGKLLFLFIIVELFARLLCPTKWYSEEERLVRDNPVKYIFIGSSRVACSIDPAAFVRAIGENTSMSYAVNMGQGYSTLMEHAFGIKRLSDAMPEKLKGAVVFLEAPNGIPELKSVQDNWLHPDYPELLATTMDLDDIWTFWLDSDTQFNFKLTVTASVLFATSKLNGEWKRVLKEVLSQTDPMSRRKSSTYEAAGVRLDGKGIQNARKLALSLAETSVKNQQTMSGAQENNLVLRRLNDQITSAGGQLVLFHMPLSSVQEKPYLSAIGKKNQTYANILLNQWKIPILHPVIKTTDDDFPDLWHLSEMRSKEYTREVAKAYLVFKGKKGA